MVDHLHLNPNMAISNTSSILSPKPSKKPTMPSSSSTSRQSYEQYLRLPELSALWTSRDFPEWKREPVIKPALQALEISFRLVSIVLSDSRQYSDTDQWTRLLYPLCSRQLEIISDLFTEADGAGGVPVADLGSARGVLARERSSQEVWRLTGSDATFLSHTSEASLLPRLAAWDKSSIFAQKLSYQIESLLYPCPFTLGLGEPNLAGKPGLEYDLIVKPAALHALKNRCGGGKRQENDVLFAVLHVFESWLRASKELLEDIAREIKEKRWDRAASDCWLLERIWRLLSEIEDLHLMMDPDDFLRLKSELAIKSSSGSDPFCFRSAALLAVTDMSKNLKHNVPNILGVEVDPNGGPRVQEAAMRLFHSPKRGDGDNRGRLHLLQAMQAVEAAVKRFFFGYRQLVTTVMGSLEATGNRGLMVGAEPTMSSDALTQMFMEPPYFPSLDAAKTFLGELWQCELNRGGSTKQ